MAKRVRFCVQCGNAQTDGSTCLKCGGGTKLSEYTDIYWSKCDDATKKEIRAQYLGSQAEDSDNSVSLLGDWYEYSGDHSSAANNELIFHAKGNRGRTIDVYPNKCVITVDVTLGSVVTGNATDGEKTIYYRDCIGFQQKRAGLAIGFIQLETASNTMNNVSSNFFNENTFTYDHYDENIAHMIEYIKSRLEVVKTGSESFSAADEIRKFKELLDIGAITEQEYQEKKERLLAL